MILYFNKVGRLLEKLEYACEEYGGAARVGTTNFKIFAYFEGVDDYEEYNIATIRLRRPDLEGSEYPDLFMIKKEDFIFDPSIESSNYFKTQDNPYAGFIFDFGSVMTGNMAVKLLDAPGIWEASITLQALGKSNVTGLVRFTVKGSVSSVDEEETQLDVSVIINNIIPVLLSDYVPYVGSVKDLDLGEHALKFGDSLELMGEGFVIHDEEESDTNVVFRKTGNNETVAYQSDLTEFIRTESTDYIIPEEDR